MAVLCDVCLELYVSITTHLLNVPFDIDTRSSCGIFSIVKTAQTAQTSGRSVYTYNTFCASLMAK